MEARPIAWTDEERAARCLRATEFSEMSARLLAVRVSRGKLQPR
jgi:hypothetical protein